MKIQLTNDEATTLHDVAVLVMQKIPEIDKSTKETLTSALKKIEEASNEGEGSSEEKEVSEGD